MVRRNDDEEDCIIHEYPNSQVEHPSKKALLVRLCGNIHHEVWIPKSVLECGSKALTSDSKKGDKGSLFIKDWIQKKNEWPTPEDLAGDVTTE